MRQEQTSTPGYLALVEQLEISPEQSYDEMAEHLLTEGEMWLQKGLALAEIIRFARGCSYILNYLGNIYIGRQAWEDAEVILLRALALAEELGDRRRIARIQESLFYLYRAQGSSEEGEAWATVALENFNALGMTQEIEGIQDELNPASSTASRFPWIVMASLT